MEIFHKDSLPAPEGWEKRKKGRGDDDRECRKEQGTREREIRKNGQKIAGSRKRGEEVIVRITGRNGGQP